MTAADELAAWLRLTLAPGVGPVLARQLLTAFGPPQQILHTPHAALARVAGAAVAAALSGAPDAATRDLIARTIDWAAQPAHACIALDDAAYPRSLLDLPDPPPLLYAVGHTALLDAPRRLAMVGTRNPTAQGERDAYAFARAFSALGVTIVSGFALGIDAAAHRGALAADGPHPGSTIAVLGTGCDRVYPARHRDLAHAVAAHGLLLSEFWAHRRPKATFRGATASSAGCRAACSWSRRRHTRARSSPRGSPPNRGARYSPFPARSTTRWRMAATASSATAPNWWRRRRTCSKNSAGRLHRLRRVQPRRQAQPATTAKPRTATCCARWDTTSAVSTSWPRAPAGARTAWARGCSTSNCRATSPGCPAGGFSASPAPKTRQRLRRSHAGAARHDDGTPRLPTRHGAVHRMAACSTS